MTLPDAIIVASSVLGFLISLYFTLVYYRLLKPDAAIVPVFCRLDERTCQYLLSTRNARILGAPNFALGLLYYAALFAYILDIANLRETVSFSFVLFVSLFTVLLSIYLAYGLIAKLKTHCVFCYTSHVCNLLIFIGLIGKRLT